MFSILGIKQNKYSSYVICTSPRSGSTLLCTLLASTGVAGNPASYFHKPSISAWLKSFDLVLDATTTERDVLDKIFTVAIAQGTLDTGMFGLRLQRDSFDFLSQQLAVLYPDLPNDSSRFHEAFGRTAYIHLIRDDKIDQAVSCVKSEQTGLWHLGLNGNELERVSPPQSPTYDPIRIGACVREMEARDRQWERWFKTESVAPLCVKYEALSDQPIKILRKILDHLGLDSEAAIDVKPGVAKMADGTNQEWVARYRSECNSS